MRLALSLVLVSLLTGRSAMGAEDRGVTLWSWTEAASLVVVGEVEDAPSDRREDAVARIRVLETWKGAVQERVEVGYSDVPGCFGDTGPALSVGQRRILFLRPSESHQGWPLWPEDLKTVWAGKWMPLRSWPLPAEDDGGLSVYRALVNRELTLLAEGAPETARREWHIDAAKRKASRWHGLYPLVGNAGRAVPNALSTVEERRAVMAGFVAEPSSASLQLVLAFVGREPDPAFDRAALEQIELSLASRIPAVTLDDAMARFLERHGAVDGDKELGLKRGKYRPFANVRKRWEKARARYLGALEPAATASR
jgi:hypothetical protein